MNSISTILSLLCGIALFLFGMLQMGDGLKKAAGNKLELILYKLTNTPIKGVILGTAVTAVIQSSSATSVMVVGFVNSGMMKLSQAIGIIMGANIGTSVTGWILCLSALDGEEGIAKLLSTATISALVAIIGIIFKMFSKKQNLKVVGDIMLGFAILMVGMQMMSTAVDPLKSDPNFVKMFTMFSNPILGILIGIVFTAIIQSASAAVGILQALAVTGSITFASAFPITMGIGIGAACPVLLSSIGTNKNGKRTALIYLFNDLLGMLFWTPVFYSINAIVHFGFMDTIMTPVSLALLNSAYRAATIMVLLPFVKYIEKLTFLIIKDDKNEETETADFDLLEKRFLDYPDLAIAQSHTAMNGMAVKSEKNIFRSINLLSEYSSEKYNKVMEKENNIDMYEDKLGTYLMNITERELNESQSKQTSKFLHTVSDFERMSDHAVNIANIAKELSEKGLNFSNEAQNELSVLLNATKDCVKLTVDTFCNDDIKNASKVEPLREYIGILCDEIKLNHISRLSAKKCQMKENFAFNDILMNLERVAAHCSNVAVAMIELEDSNFDTHEYLKSIRGMKNDEYNKTFTEYENKYPLIKKLLNSTPTELV